jgi:D-threo-aldose 1-dehydrogenase
MIPSTSTGRRIGASSGSCTAAVHGIGTVPLHNLYTAVSDDEALATLSAAWDAGVRHFDTAPVYGYVLPERRLGRALQDRPRDEYLISTKVGRAGGGGS